MRPCPLAVAFHFRDFEMRVPTVLLALSWSGVFGFMCQLMSHFDHCSRLALLSLSFRDRENNSVGYATQRSKRMIVESQKS